MSAPLNRCGKREANSILYVLIVVLVPEQSGENKEDNRCEDQSGAMCGWIINKRHHNDLRFPGFVVFYACE